MERALNRLVQKPYTKKPLPSETVGVRYNSEVVDVIHYADGNIETVNHGHNVMLNSFLPLVTDLLVNGSDCQLKYWAVGSGDDNWDSEPKQEKVFITINSTCTSGGTVKVTLDDVPYSVGVVEGDTPDTVATKLKGINFDASPRRWDVSGTGNIVIFTSQTFESLEGNHSYNDNGTNATGNVTVEKGQSNTTRRTPEPTDEGLINEVCRKRITENSTYPGDGIHFLNDEGEISQDPTNIIEIQLTFGYNEGLKDGEETPWREFSIVGGREATDSIGTGYYMNIKTHACIIKTNNMLVERKIKFTFTNADN